MKEAEERPAKTNSSFPNEMPKEQNLRNRGDETYFQVNQISFQQNFKALIGHYKKRNTSLNLTRQSGLTSPTDFEIQ